MSDKVQDDELREKLKINTAKVFGQKAGLRRLSVKQVNSQPIQSIR